MADIVCDHFCHGGRGLNPWVASCHVCGCHNAKYDAANAAALKEAWLVEMEQMGWADIRETVDMIEFVHASL